ncbi:MAG: hypothetical protein ACRDQZ_10345 [Mycobacteriales bacterium]
MNLLGNFPTCELKLDNLTLKVAVDTVEFTDRFVEKALGSDLLQVVAVRSRREIKITGILLDGTETEIETVKQSILEVARRKFRAGE